jgi:hypothetical protein
MVLFDHDDVWSITDNSAPIRNWMAAAGMTIGAFIPLPIIKTA